MRSFAESGSPFDILVTCAGAGAGAGTETVAGVVGTACFSSSDPPRWIFLMDDLALLLIADDVRVRLLLLMVPKARLLLDVNDE